MVESTACMETEYEFSGDDSGGATPVPIPNTAVKSSSADGTWTAGSWESRTSPDFNVPR